MTPSRVESIEPSSQGIVLGKLEPSFVILPVFEPATGTFRHARQISELIAIRTSKSRIVKRSFMPELFQTILQNSKRARPVPLPTDRIPGRFLTISNTGRRSELPARIAHVSEITVADYRSKRRDGAILGLHHCYQLANSASKAPPA